MVILFQTESSVHYTVFFITVILFLLGLVPGWLYKTHYVAMGNELQILWDAVPAVMLRVVTIKLTDNQSLGQWFSTFLIL